MSIQRQAMIWAAAILVAVFALWLLKGILLPFVAGMAIAYFLDPLADRLERHGLSRLMATTLITVFFVLFMIVLSIVLLPLLYNQAVALAEALPALVRDFRALLLEATNSKIAHLLGARSADVQKALSDGISNSFSWILNFIASLGSQGLQIAGVLSLIVVTPVVAFYMLLDWDRMVARLDALLPRDHAETIRRLAREINAALEGFVRGQVTVCIALGILYAVGLSLVGLRFGLIVGIVAGIISFIPYLGTITGFIVGVTLACFQFWPDYVQIGLVIAVFAAGQFIEGNFLAPKLVGKKVGLHPVWVMFALLAFASLFGFVGALLAMPVAAALGVLARFAVGRYEESKLYLGEEHPLHKSGD